MSFTDIKNKNQGFTIVELLIVVVVIAILAAITIVSYNGITNRANASAAASTAASVQKKVELYASEPDTTGYPATIADLTNTANSSKSYYISGVTLQIANPDNTNGKNTVGLLKCVSSGAPANQAAITASTISGMRINYFNYEAGSGVKTINVGITTTCPTS